MKKPELEPRNPGCLIISVERFCRHSAFLWIEFFKNRNACLDMFIIGLTQQIETYWIQDSIILFCIYLFIKKKKSEDTEAYVSTMPFIV